MLTEYDMYVRRTTDPEKFNEWLQERYNEKLDCYEIETSPES
jgi:hypothetical protein